MKNSIILLMLCFITGCGINCIEGSKGVSSTSVSVDVVPRAKVSIIEKKVKEKNGKEITQYYKKMHPHWVDTGIRVNENQKINLTINGSVNLCPKDSFNPREIIVPAISCQYGIPDDEYQNESTYFNIKKVCGGTYLKHQTDKRKQDLVNQVIFKTNVIENQEQTKKRQTKKQQLQKQQLQKQLIDQVNQMIFAPDVHTVSTFRLNKGDVFRVNLVPRKVKVKGCSSAELKDLGIIYYSDNEIFSDDKCTKPVKAEYICKNGIQSFSMKMKMNDKEECINFTEGAGAINRLQGTEVSTLVDNRYSPRGNKVFYTNDLKKDWIKAPFIYDARIVKNQNNIDKLKKQCEVIKELNKKNMISHIINTSTSDADILKYYKDQKEKNIITSEVKQDTIDVLNSFTSYDINCVCGTICKYDEPLLKQNKIPSVLTINGGSNECSITNNLDQEFKNVKKEELEKKDWTKQEWKKDVKTEIIVGLTAHFRLFDNRVDRKSREPLHRCFPSESNSQGFRCISAIFGKSVEENSIKSNVNYTYGFDEPVVLNFGIIGRYNQYAGYSGGYNIHVERMCNFVDGKKLYMYIGNTPPTMLPGSNNTIELFVPKKDKDGEQSTSGTATYTINDDNSQKKSGTIYLGVDVQGYEDQFDYRSMPSVESDNKYTVDFAINRWNPNFSKAFVMIRDFLLKVLYGLPDNQKASSISQAMDVVRTTKSKGAVQHIYTNQTTSGKLWRGVQALCTLYIIFTVLGYVIGVVKCTKYDLGVRIAKIAVIVGLLSQDSWELFSSHFFSLFVQGVSDLISTFNGELDGDNSFAFLDPTIGVLLTGEVWIRFLTLIITGPIGWLVFAMIIWAVFVFFVCIIEAVIAYLFTIVAIAFLATLAPIFITFLLFQLTKTLFDSWIKMLVNFSLQPIILFAALAFLNQVMLTVLHDVTGFTVCNQCFVGLSLPTSVAEKGAPPDICVMPVLLPVGYASELSIDDAVRESDSRDGRIGFLGLPFGITSVLILLITANAMKAFRGMSEAISQSISGSVAGIGASLHAATQSLASIVGLDQETQSIIKNAMANRRSTGQSDVNISSRANPNPVNEGESLNKDGDDSSNRPVTGDHDKLGSSSVSSGKDFDSNEEHQVSSGSRYGPVDDTLINSTKGQVLDTDSSHYKDSGDGVKDTSGNVMDDGSSKTSDNVPNEGSTTNRNDSIQDNIDGNDGKTVEESVATGDGDMQGSNDSDIGDRDGSSNAEDKVPTDNENQSNNAQQDGSSVEEESHAADRHDTIDSQDSTDGTSDNPVNERESDASESDVESSDDDTTGVGSDTEDKTPGDDDNKDESVQQNESDVEEEGNTTDRSNPMDNQDSIDDTSDGSISEGESDVSESDVESGSDDTTGVGSDTEDKTSGDDDNKDESVQQNESDVEEEGNTTDRSNPMDNQDSIDDTSDSSISEGESDVSESDVESNASESDSDDKNLDTSTTVDENNNTNDMQDAESKASNAVDDSSSESEDVGKKRGRRDINFLDGPQKQRLYMDEYSSVKEKIAGHQSAIDVETESHERSQVKRRGKKKDE
ncbi:type IV secretion system protein [Ehrlichia ruminantium]|uniref:type IV secretion system protein n=1 Tax=Ehrlichia ruminantium TaxID=779 RepID=UPI0003061EBF|nr:type IV secretion system protein [Ehrlichia ruminantium]